jgi:type II secretory pathway component PulF
MIGKIAQEISEGTSLEAAFAAVRRDLDTVFCKWEALNRQ